MRNTGSTNTLSYTQTSADAIREHVSKRIHVGCQENGNRWSLHGPDRDTVETRVSHKWIIMSTEHEMEAVLDMLSSRLMHVDDQLEMAILAWENYSQFNDDLPGYLYYDLYDAIGSQIEEVYKLGGEYSEEMARGEVSVILNKMAKTIYEVVKLIAPHLNDAVLPLLNENTRVGLVRLVGGDIATRIDQIEYVRNPQ